jgi:hypothetical protein
MMVQIVHISRKNVLHYEKIVKMCQFYSDRVPIFLQPTVLHFSHVGFKHDTLKSAS